MECHLDREKVGREGVHIESWRFDGDTGGKEESDRKSVRLHTLSRVRVKRVERAASH